MRLLWHDSRTSVQYVEERNIKILWDGEVWDGTSVEIRPVSVTSWLVCAVTISANVNKAVSVGYDLVAPKLPSQVAISGSGHISTSGSLTTSGVTLISRPYCARDRVTIAEDGSGRVPSLERVTTGVGSATGAETKKLYSLGTSSRPSWLGLSLSIAVLSNTRDLLLESTKIFWCRFTFTANSVSTTIQSDTRFYRPF